FLRFKICHRKQHKHAADDENERIEEGRLEFACDDCHGSKLGHSELVESAARYLVRYETAADRRSEKRHHSDLEYDRHHPDRVRFQSDAELERDERKKSHAYYEY